MLSGLLDLAGVLLIGLVGLILTGSLDSADLPAPIGSWLGDVLPAEGPQTEAAAILAAVAALLLLSKSVAYGCSCDTCCGFWVVRRSLWRTEWWISSSVSRC